MEFVYLFLFSILHDLLFYFLFLTVLIEDDTISLEYLRIIDASTTTNPDLIMFNRTKKDPLNPITIIQLNKKSIKQHAFNLLEWSSAFIVECFVME